MILFNKRNYSSMWMPCKALLAKPYPIFVEKKINNTNSLVTGRYYESIHCIIPLLLLFKCKCLFHILLIQFFFLPLLLFKMQIFSRIYDYWSWCNWNDDNTDIFKCSSADWTSNKVWWITWIPGVVNDLLSYPAKYPAGPRIICTYIYTKESRLTLNI